MARIAIELLPSQVDGILIGAAGIGLAFWALLLLAIVLARRGK